MVAIIPIAIIPMVVIIPITDHSLLLLLLLLMLAQRHQE